MKRRDLVDSHYGGRALGEIALALLSSPPRKPTVITIGQESGVDRVEVLDWEVPHADDAAPAQLLNGRDEHRSDRSAG